MSGLILFVILNIDFASIELHALRLVIGLRRLDRLCGLEQCLVVLLELAYEVAEFRDLDRETAAIVAVLVSRVVHFERLWEHLRYPVGIHELKAGGAHLSRFSLAPDVGEVGGHGLDDTHAEVAREELCRHVEGVDEGAGDRARHVHDSDPVPAQIVFKHYFITWFDSLPGQRGVQRVVWVHLGLPPHLCVLSQSRVGANQQVDRVVKWLEEGFGHVDDGTRDYIFLFFTKKFLLFECLELSLFQLRLTSPLLQDALVLAARAEYFVSLERVEVGHLSEGELHILH